MKVKELIEELQKFDPECEVTFYCDQDGRTYLVYRAEYNRIIDEVVLSNY